MRTEMPDLAGGGPALFRLVRFWSRRWAADAARAGAGDARRTSGTCWSWRPSTPRGRGSGAIGEVARQLGLDRSNASRMLAEAVAAGLVTKTVSPDDARRTELGITAAGHELLAAARAWQDQAFARLVAGWPAADARRLAGYLQRLAAESAGAPAARPGSPRYQPPTTETGGRP